MPRGYWTCSRTTDGVRCRAVNPNRKRKCGACGKTRVARRRPAHMAALDIPYAEYVKLNGGEWCGICGKEPGVDVKLLHRDHDHRTGKPRGLLCFPCNSALRPYMTLDWLRDAVEYVERTTEHCDCCGKEGTPVVFSPRHNARFCAECGPELVEAA